MGAPVPLDVMGCALSGRSIFDLFVTSIETKSAVAPTNNTGIFSLASFRSASLTMLYLAPSPPA